MDLSQLLGGPHFRTTSVAYLNGIGVRLNSLIDTGAQGFLFLNTSIAFALARSLRVPIRSLPRKVQIRGFKDTITSSATHFIRLHLRIDGRTILNCPFVILDLGQQDCIIGLRWLKRFRIKLDAEHHRLIWPSEYPPSYMGSRLIIRRLYQHSGSWKTEHDILRRNALWERDQERQQNTPGAQVNRVKGLHLPKPRPPAPPPFLPPHRRPPEEDKATWDGPRISLVTANAFHYIMKRPENEFFTTSILEMDQLIDRKRSEANSNAPQLPRQYQEFSDVFDKEAALQLPPHRPYNHSIVLTEPLPNSYSPLYKQNLEELEATREFVTTQLQHGLIEQSRSPFASPVLCVRKANGKLRVCVDYRKLNAVTRKDAYPIPRIDELLARPGKAKIFTKFDIHSAFNKIRMDPASEEYTTFRTRYGTYKCKVLPFGLCNGPATYQRYMNDVLMDYLDDFCIAYLDDILIYSEDERSHVRHVKLVLKRLRQAGLQVDLKKSEFHVTRTRYLGYVLTNKGLEVDPEKVEALRNWARPTTVTGVKSFLGFTGFYRQFIPGYSRIAKPLIKLQSPAVPFEWAPACDQAFDELREGLLSIPTLCHFDPDLPTKIETDASDGVIAGVLSQLHADGIWKPCAFYSKTLSGAELNWEIHDKELFAIVTAFKLWRAELTSVQHRVQVFSDHRSLEYFMTTKVLNARQIRWAEALSEFNFLIEYTPGRDNARADILSRREQDLNGLHSIQKDNRSRVFLGPHRLHPDINRELAEKYLREDTVQINSLTPDADSAMQLDSLQLTDALLQENRNSFDSERQNLPSRFRIQEGLLLQGNRLCIPTNSPLTTRLIREAHDQVSTAHPSATKTYHLLARRYYWKGMLATCKQYVRNCVACRRAHPRQLRPAGEIRPLPIPERPMQHLCMDFKEFPRDKHGYDQILVIIDRLSKQAVSIPCHKNVDSRGLAQLFIQWIYRFGHTPVSIVSDRGPQFVSSFWSAFCQIIGTKVKLSTAYHKETDGQTEIMNKYIDQRLRPFVNYYQDNWSELLPMIDRAQATLPHSSIGISPYQVLFGSEPRQSWDWEVPTPPHPRDKLNFTEAKALASRMHAAWVLAKTNLEKAQQRMQTQVNPHRRTVDWDVGDYVYLQTDNLANPRPSRKLSDKWTGPFEVLERVGHSYRLRLPPGSKIHDVFAPTVLCKDPRDTLPGQAPPKPPGIPVDGVEEWEVEEILASKLVRNTLKYRVSWVGHDPDPVWYNASNFMGAPHKLKAFHDKYPTKPGPPRSLWKWIRAWEDGTDNLEHLEDDRI